MNIITRLINKLRRKKEVKKPVICHKHVTPSVTTNFPIGSRVTDDKWAKGNGFTYDTNDPLNPLNPISPLNPFSPIYMMGSDNPTTPESYHETLPEKEWGWDVPASQDKGYDMSPSYDHPIQSETPPPSYEAPSYDSSSHSYDSSSHSYDSGSSSWDSGSSYDSGSSCDSSSSSSSD